MTWLIWVFGTLLLLAAGFGATYLPRRRARDLADRTAWSSARAAIESAEVSRDACPDGVVEAERLLALAAGLAAAGGGAAVADEAREHAERADHLWRAAAGE
ncbi:DUF6403 family protein [Actinophytocola gossypii]|uniref:Uncharacterized protein n=1 Tax=Actinophytocola gossypii TaxID=2812003 RepID=A0ABT2JCV6_9PSEU|nr:DUF6403 family protein [Actinophytocola gossypii]MCT2585704.1 hypothetical protein [Actinophytocola gossypii]